MIYWVMSILKKKKQIKAKALDLWTLYWEREMKPNTVVGIKDK